MKKILLFIAIAVASIVSVRAEDVKNNISTIEPPVYEEVFLDKTLPGPEFRFLISIKLGKKKLDCEGYWPICYFRFKPEDPILSKNELPSIFEVYRDKVVICISKKDIANVGSDELKRKLVGVRSVTFGQDAEFPIEVTSKCGLKSNFGIDAAESYKVTSDKDNVYINVPF